MEGGGPAGLHVFVALDNPVGMNEQSCTIEAVLNDDALCWVLERLTPSEILTNSALVNKRWGLVARSEELWLPRLPDVLREAVKSQGRTSPPSASGSRHGSSSSHAGSRRPSGAPLSSAALYCRLFLSNLLTNPWLDPQVQLEQRASGGGDTQGRGRTPWFAPGGGHNWAWEGQRPEGLLLPNAGAAQPPLPPAPPPPYPPQSRPALQHGVVASAYNWNAPLVQLVDLATELRQRGLSQAAAESYLDSCPHIELSVWVAGRFDCGGRFSASLAVDSGERPLPSMTPGNLGAWMGGPDVLLVSSGVQEAQPCNWVQLTMVAAEYPPGVRPRRALVHLLGSDTRRWTGHYGAKFGSPTLRFLPPPG